METMEHKRRRVRREFSEEFKADIVARCRVGDRSALQVAKDFDLTPSSVRRWVAQAAVDAGERPGLTTEERQELSELRRENKRLREDVGTTPSPAHHAAAGQVDHRISPGSSRHRLS